MIESKSFKRGKLLSTNETVVQMLKQDQWTLLLLSLFFKKDKSMLLLA